MTDQAIFGTDGIRGRAGQGWLTDEGAQRIGWAVGRAMGPAARGGRALLAHDGRRSGPWLEAALTRGLAAAGIEAVSAGLLPTPALAWLTRNRDFALGLMVSASHNPAEDNGIKVFGKDGDKPSDALQEHIEELLREGHQPTLESDPSPVSDPGLEEAYLDHLHEHGAAGMTFDGRSLVVDCANGAGSRVGARVLSRLGCEVVSIFDQPDGENINQGCGSTQPQALQAEVRRRKADLGIALDGDGDRCILVDERGELVHGDGIMTVLGRDHAGDGDRAHARVVATVMSNRGLHRALRDVGVGVLEVAVGDRAVVEGLRREGLALGGEQSGHIVLGARNDYIGDGLFTALAVLGVMARTEQPLSALAAPYRPMPQVLLNVPVSSKPDLAGLDEVRRRVDAATAELGQDGRVLLRYSGTEALARVMVEGPDTDGIQRLADHIAEAVRAEIGA